MSCTLVDQSPRKFGSDNTFQYSLIRIFQLVLYFLTR